MSATNTSAQFDKYIGEARPLLVEFYNPECSKCLETLPQLEQLKREFGPRANVMAVDGHSEAALRETYKIDTYPTYILFKDGKVAWRDSGRKDTPELRHMVEDFI